MGRVCVGLGVLLSVLLLHAALLWALPQRAPPASADTPRRAPPLHLVAAAPAAASPAPAPTLVARPDTPAVPQVQARPRAPLPRAEAAPEPSPAVTVATVAAAESTAAAPVPVYATQLPAPALLRYELRRGEALGSAELVWRREGEDYALSLDAELQGKPVLGSTSRGQVDADGVAPLRLVDRRREKELRAVNFQRNQRRITFSGPQVDYPLLPGAQDRLSWMLQLPAILEAEPALARSGARVTLYVVGTRGDAEAWHFEVLGRDTLALPAGPVAQALLLRREASRPYDTRVEVWLDPQRQHLPVRLRFTTVPDGQPTELRLSEAVAAPT